MALMVEETDGQMRRGRVCRLYQLAAKQEMKQRKEGRHGKSKEGRLAWGRGGGEEREEAGADVK